MSTTLKTINGLLAKRTQELANTRVKESFKKTFQGIK